MDRRQHRPRGGQRSFVDAHGRLGTVEAALATGTRAGWEAIAALQTGR